MKKQFCDFCGKEIGFELEYQVEIYNHIDDDYDYQKDVCEECKKKILAFLKTLGGKNGK